MNKVGGSANKVQGTNNFVNGDGNTVVNDINPEALKDIQTKMSRAIGC